MSTHATIARPSVPKSLGVRLFEIAVFVAAIGAVAFPLARHGLEGLARRGFIPGVVFWGLIIGLVELLPVPIWRSLRVSIGSPLFMAVAFIYPPEVAGLIAFFGATDPREFRGDVRFLRALFNRSQISLSTLVASLVFHSLGGNTQSWAAAIPAALAAVVADFIVNIVLVAVTLTEDAPFKTVVRKFRIGSPAEFLISYIGLGLLGIILARLFGIAVWAVAAFALPLLLARQMFFRTRALEDASKELGEQQVALRALSNRMAEERADERAKIAGYLHDDLAQHLYRMSLHIDISEKHIQEGNEEGARAELETVRSAKDETMKLMREIIRDLHQSPVGRTGLAEALRTLARDVQEDAGITMKAQLQDIDIPATAQLLCYQIAREAVMNAVKHAHASSITIALKPTADGVRATVTDDGRGFDPETGSPEGHYGLAMMRERALVARGTFRVDSSPGLGTTVTVELPTSWLKDEGTSPDGASTDVPA